MSNLDCKLQTSYSNVDDYLGTNVAEFGKDFLSHFREFWPRRLVFFMLKRQLNAEDWPRIWHGAQRVSSNLAIDMDIG